MSACGAFLSKYNKRFMLMQVLFNTLSKSKYTKPPIINNIVRTIKTENDGKPFLPILYTGYIF